MPRYCAYPILPSCHRGRTIGKILILNFGRFLTPWHGAASWGADHRKFSIKIFGKVLTSDFCRALWPDYRKNIICDFGRFLTSGHPLAFPPPCIHAFAFLHVGACTIASCRFLHLALRAKMRVASRRIAKANSTPHSCCSINLCFHMHF